MIPEHSCYVEVFDGAIWALFEKSTNLNIHISPSEAEFNTYNMKKFDITDRIKEIFKDNDKIYDVKTSKRSKSLMSFK